MRFTLPTVVLGVLVAPALVAQSTLYRPPNLDGAWVADGGVVQFNFLHRFYVAPSAGSNKVTNFPTFVIGAGLGPAGTMVGTRYASNSFVVTTPYRPNEIELFLRWRTLGRGAEGRDGFALFFTEARNFAARSWDSELAAAYSRGRLTLNGAFRFISRAFGQTDETETALAGGAVLRLSDYVAVGGDWARLLDRDTTAAWSAGVSLLIPGSPHTFSLHASKATSNTIQGASFGFSRTIYGFEFTIPLHLKRFAPWFKGGRSQPPAREAGIAVEVRMEGIKFREDSITISPGQAVQWTNLDPLEHTVTFERGAPSSGPLARNGTFVVRFDRPGTYVYHCTPHPYMKGVVVVR